MITIRQERQDKKMIKLSKTQLEIVKTIHEGLGIGNSYTISSYLGHEVRIEIRQAGKYVNSCSLNKNTLAALLKNGMLVPAGQKNNNDDVYADYAEWTNYWVLSEQGKWLCEELFGVIQQPVTQEVVEVVETIVEMQAVNQVVETTNEVVQPIATDKLTDDDRKVIAHTLLAAYRKSYADFETKHGNGDDLKGDARTQYGYVFGEALERDCNKVYPNLVTESGKPYGFRLAAELRWADADDAREVETVFNYIVENMADATQEDIEVEVIEPAKEVVQSVISPPSVTITMTLEELEFVSFLLREAQWNKDLSKEVIKIGLSLNGRLFEVLDYHSVSFQEVDY